MKILVMGANGQVGWELTQQPISSETILIPVKHSECDITSEKDVEKLFERYQPNILINTAAYTAVDKAESEKDLAFTINRNGPEILAKACQKLNIPLIHLSTDYIFSGEKKSPYQEEDLAQPVNVYGESKLAGEISIRANLEKHLILRVSGLFSSHGHNFVKTMLRFADERETLRIVSDQTICPTFAGDIAETILKMIPSLMEDHSLWGTYHYCNQKPTSWYDFTKEIINNIKSHREIKVKEIIPIKTIEYPMPAKRPAYSVLDCYKIEKHFGIAMNNWKDGLKNTLEVLMK